MSKLAVVGIALLALLFIGMTHEPDSGTAASVGSPDVAEATVGANHAKPLPRVLSAGDLLALSRVLTPTVLALALLHLLVRPSPVGLARGESGADRDPSVLRSVATSRRGPPALA